MFAPAMWVAVLTAGTRRDSNCSTTGGSVRTCRLMVSRCHALFSVLSQLRMGRPLFVETGWWIEPRCDQGRSPGENLVSRAKLGAGYAADAGLQCAVVNSSPSIAGRTTVCEGIIRRWQG